MSSCFFSSRLKMRISFTSVSRKRRRTALPKEPVPPVISNTLPENIPRNVIPVSTTRSSGRKIRSDQPFAFRDRRVVDQDGAKDALEHEQTACSGADYAEFANQRADIVERTGTS